jgi:hypothetical protein
LDDFISPEFREYMWDTVITGSIVMIGYHYFKHVAVYTSLDNFPYLQYILFVVLHLNSIGNIFGYRLINLFNYQNPKVMFWFTKEKRSFYHWFLLVYFASYFASYVYWGAPVAIYVMFGFPAIYIPCSIINYFIPNYFRLYKVVRK